jgi:hypothetical protein
VGEAAIHAQYAFKDATNAVPFEFQMLEVLLDQTVTHLEHNSAQIRLLAKVVEEGIAQRINSADIWRLTPLQKVVTGLQHDIRDTRQVIQNVRC